MQGLENFDFSSLSIGEIIGGLIAFLVVLFVLLSIQTALIKLGTSWSAKFKLPFWGTFGRVVVMTIISMVVQAILAAITTDSIVTMLVNFVVSVVLNKMLLVGFNGERLNWGHAIIVALFVNVVMIVGVLAIGMVAGLLGIAAA